MLLNAVPLNAGLLGAAAGEQAPEEGLFRPRALASAVVFGAPQWLVHMAFAVPSVASTRIGVPTLVLGVTRRFDAKGLGPLARAGMPSLRLVYAGGVPAGPQVFTAGGLRATRLGAAQLQLRIALDVASVASTCIGMPGMVQVLRVPGTALAPRPGQPALVLCFHPAALVLGRWGVASLAQIFRPATLARTSIGQPALHLRSSGDIADWYAGAQVGMPRLCFVHRVYPGSRLARAGQPSLRRGHAC